jgi:UDP-hydrolysing UDP-N-acetyl-D-glucosamine 2-epimerase
VRKVCVVIGSRANYSSIKSAMKAIKEHEKLQLQVVATASALLDRYGSVVELIENDGFGVDAKIFSLIEGETLQTMAKSTGIGLIELPTVFEKLKPDIVVTVGDRFETMATTLAAAYMNIPLAHTMGGEVTGTIDESIRHAITKFAHIHFPASEDAAKRIVKLGERSQDVYLVGCPRIDLVAQVLKENEDNTDIFLEGVGSKFDLRSPFILVSQHPVTTEYGEGENQIQETLLAVKKVGLPAIVLWPNSDAGAEDIARGIRKWRERGLDENMHFFKNLPTETYIRLMKTTACLVGNSSSGIREGAYIGTPVVNIGSRQDSRARASNVIDIAEIKNELIEKAIQKQILHGCYQSEHLYGDGSSGQKIADILSKCSWQIQKRISY